MENRGDQGMECRDCYQAKGRGGREGVPLWKLSTVNIKSQEGGILCRKSKLMLPRRKGGSTRVGAKE